MSNVENPWTEDAVKDLRQMWIDGKSCTEIATALSHKYGRRFTRNAAIGKVHRIKLNLEFPRQSVGGRPTGFVALARQRNPRPPKPPKAVKPPKAQKAPPPPPIIVDVSHARPWTERARFGECAFPIGEQGSIMSCCAPIGENERYCAGHRAVMFQPAKPLKPYDLGRAAPKRRVLTAWDEGRAAA